MRRSFAALRITGLIYSSLLLQRSVLRETVFFSQSNPLIAGQRCDVRFPSRTPIRVPSPKPPQKRLGGAIVLRSKPAILTVMGCHRPSPSEPIRVAPPSRRLSGGRPRPPRRRYSVLKTCILPRLDRHLMRPLLFDRGRCERKRESRASVPRRPLVHVMRTEEDSAFSRHQVQRAYVKVRKVPRQPFGRPKLPARRSHRERAPAQRTQSRPREAPNQRKLAEHRMIDFNRMIFSPFPSAEVGRNFRGKARGILRAGSRQLYRVLHRHRQQVPVIRISRRQPTRRLLGEHVL